MGFYTLDNGADSNVDYNKSIYSNIDLNLF